MDGQSKVSRRCEPIHFRSRASLVSPGHISMLPLYPSPSTSQCYPCVHPKPWCSPSAGSGKMIHKGVPFCHRAVLLIPLMCVSPLSLVLLRNVTRVVTGAARQRSLAHTCTRPCKPSRKHACPPTRNHAAHAHRCACVPHTMTQHTNARIQM